MKKSYKLLTKYLLVFLVTSVLISCDKCDKEDTEPKLDLTLLFEKQWQLVKLTYNESGQDVVDNIPACLQDDVIEFKPDKMFTRHNGQNKCNQEADSETSEWSIFQEPKALIFEDIEYQIVDLSPVNLNLQRELQGAEGKVLVKYFYVPK